MGRGDIHLLLLLGSFLGFEHEIPALLIGALSGSSIGGIYVFITHKELRSFELPLGSFLCLGAGIAPLIQRLQ
jgi:leader peptidase (prepilin peptidase)/N-methyltransferase